MQLLWNYNGQFSRLIWVNYLWFSFSITSDYLSGCESCGCSLDLPVLCFIFLAQIGNIVLLSPLHMIDILVLVWMYALLHSVPWLLFSQFVLLQFILFCGSFFRTGTVHLLGGMEAFGLWKTCCGNFKRPLPTWLKLDRWILTSPYIWLGRLLHLPSTEAISVWPKAHTWCNRRLLQIAVKPLKLKIDQYISSIHSNSAGLHLVGFSAQEFRNLSGLRSTKPHQSESGRPWWQIGG